MARIGAGRWLVFPAALVLLAGAALPCGGKEKVSYRVFVAQPALSNSPVFGEGPLPAHCVRGRLLELTACRGEYESASFVLDADAPLRAVQIIPADLHGPTDLPPPDVRLVQRLPISTAVGNVVMPWALVHDPGLVDIIPGYAPSVAALTEPEIGPYYRLWSSLEYKQAHEAWALLKKPLIDAERLLPVNVARREQFWVTVHISSDAPAGQYESYLRVQPENAEDTVLLLKVRVPAFDLAPAPFTYSVYHPTDHVAPPLTDAQLLGDYCSMAAHGLTNPNLYAGPEGDKTGPVRFDRLNHLLDLREAAGLPKGDLYLFDGAGLIIADRLLTAAEKQRTREVAAATVAWATGRGYRDVYFMGCDEFSGERLSAERESWEAVRAGGAQIYVAGAADLIPRAGDILGCAVLMDPDALDADWNQWTMTTRQGMTAGKRYWASGRLLKRDYQDMIAEQHRRGYKVFTYMDPIGGAAYPEDQRRCRGLGLWKTGLDGTMTWAWTHYRQPTLGVGKEMPVGGHGFVLRGPAAPIETLALEGFREGVDDARYLATLQAQIARGGRGAQAAQRWLDGISLRADLRAWRQGMVGWIEALRGE